MLRVASVGGCPCAISFLYHLRHTIPEGCGGSTGLSSTYFSCLMSPQRWRPTESAQLLDSQ
eukprot:2846048-Alexandrium_andersonii.AAC.1